LEGLSGQFSRPTLSKSGLSRPTAFARWAATASQLDIEIVNIERLYAVLLSVTRPDSSVVPAPPDLGREVDRDVVGR